jgi:hypothetical protein
MGRTVPVTNDDISINQRRNGLSRIDLPIIDFASEPFNQNVQATNLGEALRHMFRVEEINFPGKGFETNVFFFRVMTHLSTKSKPISLATSKHDLAGGLAGRNIV